MFRSHSGAGQTVTVFRDGARAGGVHLHLPHQLAREAAQIAHLFRMFRRDDEAEVMPIQATASTKADPSASFSIAE